MEFIRSSPHYRLESSQFFFKNPRKCIDKKGLHKKVYNMIICSYNTYEPLYFSISFVPIHPNRPTIKAVDHYCDEWDAGKAKRNNQFEYLKEKNKRGKIDAKDDMRLLKTLLSDAVNVRKYLALAIIGDQLPHCRYSFLSRPESQNKQIHDWSVVRVTSREDSQRPRKATSFSKLSWARCIKVCWWFHLRQLSPLTNRPTDMI